MVPESIKALPFGMSLMVKGALVLHRFNATTSSSSSSSKGALVIGQIHCNVPRKGIIWVKFDGDRRPTECMLNPADYFNIWCFIENNVLEKDDDDDDSNEKGDDDDDDSGDGESEE